MNFLVQKGFSIIELVLVLCLISIIVLLSGSHSFFLQRMTLRAELEHLYTVCYMLQRSAMMLRQPQALFFDVAHNMYRYKKTTYRLPARVCFGAGRGVQGPPSHPHAAIENPVTFQDAKIIFTSDGIVQSGTVYLTDDSRRYTYALSCAVGHVSYLRKYQYTNKWVSF